MDDQRRLLRHFLAAIAYRTQKALRGAPSDFADFQAAPKVRTPRELIRHMDSVLGYSRTFFIGGSYRPPLLPDFGDVVAHFHETLADVAKHVASDAFKESTPEQLLQGPFSDAMTHAGQLALLRRHDLEACLFAEDKTRAVFDRYNIVNERELLQAAERLVEYLGGSATGKSRSTRRRQTADSTAA